MRTVRQLAPLLRRLKHSVGKTRRDIIRKCDHHVICTLSKCCHNVLKGNVLLTPVEKIKLRRHKHNLRKLSTKKTSIYARKKILQRGSNMDRSNPDHANAGERNYRLQKRATFTNRGVIVDMIGRIHSDIFFQDRYMLNEVNVKVRLVRNKDSFCLTSGEANPSYKVKLISAVLLVRKMQLSPSVFLAHAKALESGLAKYPIKQDLHYPGKQLGRQSRETVYRSTPVESRNRMRGQWRFLLKYSVQI